MTTAPSPTSCDQAPLLQAFADRIATTRRDFNLTRHALAQIVGYDASSVGRWESQRHEPPRLSTMAKVIERIDALYRQRDEPQASPEAVEQLEVCHAQEPEIPHPYPASSDDVTEAPDRSHRFPDAPAVIAVPRAIFRRLASVACDEEDRTVDELAAFVLEDWLRTMGEW